MGVGYGGCLCICTYPRACAPCVPTYLRSPPSCPTPAAPATAAWTPSTPGHRPTPRRRRRRRPPGFVLASPWPPCLFVGMMCCWVVKRWGASVWSGRNALTRRPSQRVHGRCACLQLGRAGWLSFLAESLLPHADGCYTYIESPVRASFRRMYASLMAPPPTDRQSTDSTTDDRALLAVGRINGVWAGAIDASIPLLEWDQFDWSRPP